MQGPADVEPGQERLLDTRVQMGSTMRVQWVVHRFDAIVSARMLQMQGPADVELGQERLLETRRRDGHRRVFGTVDRRVQQMVAAVSQRQRMYHIRQHHVLERVLRVQRLANVERERLHRDVVDDRGGWNVRVVPGGCGVRIQRRNPRDRWGLLHVWVLHGPQIETGVRRGRESRRVLGVRSGLGENDLRCRVRKSVRPIQKMQGRYQFVEHGAVLRSPMVRNGGVHESRRHGSRDPTVWTGDGGGVHVQRRLDDDRLVSRQSKTEQRGPVRPGVHVRPRLRYQDRQMRRQQSADGSV